jgi:Membrane-bound lytic murein transglycosylase
MERNLIPSEEMSMQRIREWMAAHPDEATNVRATNRSHIFFRITGLTIEGDPDACSIDHGRGRRELRHRHVHGISPCCSIEPGFDSEIRSCIRDLLDDVTSIPRSPSNGQECNDKRLRDISTQHHGGTDLCA